jgi:hypothetical protein
MNCICPEHVGPPIPPPTIRSPLAQGVPPSTAYGGSTLGWCARDQDAQATPTLSGGNHPPPRHRGHRTHRPDPRRHPRDPHSAPRAPECRMPSCWQEQESATVLPTFDDKPHRTMLRERAATPQVEISAKRLTLAELRVVGAFAHLPRICYRVTPAGARAVHLPGYPLGPSVARLKLGRRTARIRQPLRPVAALSDRA